MTTWIPLCKIRLKNVQEYINTAVAVQSADGTSRIQ